MSVALTRCVACGADDLQDEERANGYRLMRCKVCGLTQTVNPDYSRERYLAAYAHEAEASPLAPENADIYSAPERRLQLEARALWVPQPRLTPAERAALSWLDAHVPAGGAVVDCGCGTGRFLRALQRRKIRATGIELSPRVVELLRRCGLEAVEGSAPDFAWSGDSPSAITFFEVLEHLPDPELFLAPLRERFPHTHILASVPAPQRIAVLRQGRGAVDYPPNHFLRWTPEALARFFRRIGYTDVTVIVPPLVGAELAPGFAAASARAGIATSAVSAADHGRIAATAAIAAARLYQVAAAAIGMPQARAWRRRGATSSSMLVIASP